MSVPLFSIGNKWMPHMYSLRIFPHSGETEIQTGAFGWALWLTSVILALRETEVSGSQGQEFETSLTNTVKPCHY